MLKQPAKLFWAALSLVVLPAFLWASSSWDSERLALETQMQTRVEEALAKILPPGKFVVVIKVEPWDRPLDAQGKPIEDDEYYLPGVPKRNGFDDTADEVRRLTETLKPDSPLFKRFVKRIAVTMVIDNSIPEENVEQIRELARQMLGFDPERGDTINIERTQFYQAPVSINDSPLFKFQEGLRDNWMVISLSLILFSMMIFFLFIFGPLRGFLNRFVQVLPTLKTEGDRGAQRIPPQMVEFMQLFPQLMAQQMGGMLPHGGGVNPGSFQGSLQVENPNKNVMPFGFIREDHLPNLALILARETPERAAVVLGYLPPEWISRVLTRIEPSQQSEIANHLSQTRQLLPEQVEDIEQDLRRRLDYLVGGPERLAAIYETLDPDNQRKMLENLRDVHPDLAEELRRKSLMFEDIVKLEGPNLKAILREADLQTLVTSLQGMPEDFLEQILQNVTPGKAEIVREELELNKVTPGKATKDAQRKVVLIAKRLEREGQIVIPEISDGSPQTRFGMLRENLRLPEGMSLDEPEAASSGEAIDLAEEPVSEDIEMRIRNFMSRGTPGQERYPGSDFREPKE